MSNRTVVAELSGFGDNGSSVARLVELDCVQILADRISRATPRGLIVCGAGQAHGDCTQNGGGDVVTLGGQLAAAESITIDPDSYTAVVPAGVTLAAAARRLLHHGWFLPVSPDSRRMTIGAAIAADVAATNHSTRGSFADHINAIWVIDGRGELQALRPHDDTAEYFWSTVGGLGLTGVVTAAEVSLIPVSSAWMSVETRRHSCLGDVMAALVEPDDRAGYRSAWLDTTARGKSFGRGVVSGAAHARVTDLPPMRQADALDLGPAYCGAINRLRFGSVINRWTVRAFNEARFRSAPAHRRIELQPISNQLHSRDSTAHRRDTYGKRGSVHYQMCVPDDEADAIGAALMLLAEPGRVCLWALLSRFGPGNPAPLSFAAPGWSIDLEFPADLPDLGRTLDDVDELVVAAGGRVNLAKDARLRPQLVTRMYPEIPRWRAVRNQMDPDAKFASDLARRLSL